MRTKLKKKNEGHFSTLVDQHESQEKRKRKEGGEGKEMKNKSSCISNMYTLPHWEALTKRNPTPWQKVVFLHCTLLHAQQECDRHLTRAGMCKTCAN